MAIKIGVFSLEKGKGCTNVASLIANHLASGFNKVAVVEPEDSANPVFKTANVPFGSDGTFFMNSVHYYPLGCGVEPTEEMVIVDQGYVNILKTFDSGFDRLYLCADSAVESAQDIQSYLFDSGTECEVILFNASQSRLATFKELGIHCFSILPPAADQWVCPRNLSIKVDLLLRSMNIVPPQFDPDFTFEKIEFHYKPEQEKAQKKKHGLFGGKKKKTEGPRPEEAAEEPIPEEPEEEYVRPVRHALEDDPDREADVHFTLPVFHEMPPAEEPPEPMPEPESEPIPVPETEAELVPEESEEPEETEKPVESEPAPEPKLKKAKKEKPPKEPKLKKEKTTRNSSAIPFLSTIIHGKEENADEPEEPEEPEQNIAGDIEEFKSTHKETETEQEREPRSRKGKIKTKTVYLGHLSIFVTSLRHGCGCSYLAGSLASALTDIYGKDIWIERGDGSAPLPDNYMVHEIRNDEDRFEAYQSGYIIYDQGVYKELSEVARVDLLRSDVHVMVCTGDEQDIIELSKFIREQGEHAYDWLYLFNHVLDNRKKAVEEAMADFNTLIVPFHDSAEVPAKLAKDYRSAVEYIARR
jgi:hypothetical protein